MTTSFFSLPMNDNWDDFNSSFLKISPNTISKIANVENGSKAIHQALEIKLFTEGSSTLLIGNQTVTVREGDVVVINPYEFHATILNHNDVVKYHLLMIPLDLFVNAGLTGLNLVDYLLVKKHLFKTVYNDNAQLQYVLSRIANEYRKPSPIQQLAIFGLLIELMSILLNYVSQLDSNISDNHFFDNSFHLYSLIEPALQYIRNNYSNQITLKDLAVLCNISVFHLAHSFKTVTGKTIVNYIQQYRLNIASILLKTTDYSLDEIALKCGFCDKNYFTRCYKKQFGITPSQQKRLRI